MEITELANLKLKRSKYSLIGSVASLAVGMLMYFPVTSGRLDYLTEQTIAFVAMALFITAFLVNIAYQKNYKYAGVLIYLVSGALIIISIYAVILIGFAGSVGDTHFG
jgi:uncharacterized membrane protein YjjP (DUF1212 family)